jgi:predicted acyltransferase (DUF342 family)
VVNKNSVENSVSVVASVSPPRLESKLERVGDKVELGEKVELSDEVEADGEVEVNCEVEVDGEVEVIGEVEIDREVEVDSGVEVEKELPAWLVPLLVSPAPFELLVLFPEE